MSSTVRDGCPERVTFYMGRVRAAPLTTGHRNQYEDVITPKMHGKECTSLWVAVSDGHDIS